MLMKVRKEWRYNKIRMGAAIMIIQERNITRLVRAMKIEIIPIAPVQAEELGLDPSRLLVKSILGKKLLVAYLVS